MRSLPLVPLLVAFLSAASLRAQEPTAEPAQQPSQPTTSPAPSPSQPPAATEAVTPSPEPLPEAVTPALDTLGGHLTLSGGAGLAVPFGRLDSELSQSRRLGPGLALTLSAAYGVSRMVALGLWGDTQRLSDGSARDSSSGTGFGAGALVVYHLVQGVRFDPWLAAGLGYRTVTIASDAPHATYSGPELVHVVVGGDWYATSLLGLGPTLELSAGTYSKRPADAGSARAYWHFQTTLRVTLDLPGK